jgi:type I restriction enzyme S subunit
LIDIGEINPRNEADEDLIAAFVPMSGVPQIHAGQVVYEKRRWGLINSGFTHFAVNDVVLAKITPCFENGKAAVITGLNETAGIGAGTTELHVFRPIHPGIVPQFIYLVLRSPYFRVLGEQNMTGTAGQKRLPTEYFATRSVPLPPTDEQLRIVKKVDALMSICDRLQSQLSTCVRARSNSRVATLSAAGRANNSRELQDSWKRVSSVFNLLFRDAEDVQELQSFILELAFRGLLTQRSMEDEPAPLLIQRALLAKRARALKGSLKTKKPPITNLKEIPVIIPSSWQMTRLDDLFQFIDYRGRTPPKVSSGVVLITAKNVRPGMIVREPVEYISATSYREWMTRGFPEMGDLLITTEAPLGNVARIDGPADFALAQRVINLQPFTDVNTKCLMYLMMSPHFQQLLRENSTGMTAKGIKAAKLKQLTLPVPPKQEQDRIVNRVEDLFRMCERLGTQLKNAGSLSCRLADVAVAAVAGQRTVVQEVDELKIPQTELIAILRLGEVPDGKGNSPLASIMAHSNGEMEAGELYHRFGGEIDAFYTQLKREVEEGWILEPEPAIVRDREVG